MKEITKRLVKIAEFYKASKPCDFARIIGVSDQTASNYLQGVRIPTLEILFKIQSSFDRMNIDWLLNGRGEMLIDEQISQHSKLIAMKDLEIGYLKKSNLDKDEVIQSKEELIQSQKTLIKVLSEKAGIDLTDLSEVSEPKKSKKSQIKGFGGLYHDMARHIINEFELIRVQ